VAEGDLRLFIAVPIPPDALDACRVLIDGVRAHLSPPGVRWVRLDGLHVTLRFLGATRPQRVPDVGTAIRSAAGGAQAFPISLAGAGSFPERKRPRTLWIGIDEGVEPLAALVRGLDAPLEALGWPPEQRAFRPHLTIARTDAAHGDDGLAVASELATAARDWRVTFRAETVTLYRSLLGAGPARYEPIDEVRLAG
jgi:2'-5' RNA ligase